MLKFQIVVGERLRRDRSASTVEFGKQSDLIASLHLGIADLIIDKVFGGVEEPFGSYLGSFQKPAAEELVQEKVGNGCAVALLVVANVSLNTVPITNKQAYFVDLGPLGQHEILQMLHAERMPAAQGLHPNPSALLFLQLEDDDAR